MCITIPKEVVAIQDNWIEVRRSGTKKTEKAGALIDVKVGDWVFTQNNFIVRKITRKQAQEINKIFNNSPC